MMDTGIELYLHCRKCIGDKVAPNTEVGLSKTGELIVWCRRHGVAVCRIEGSDAMKAIVRAGCQGHNHKGETT